MDYNKLAFIFLFSLIFSFLIAPIIINFLYKHKVWKRRDENLQKMEGTEKEYKNRTPILGGIIFVIGAAITTILFNWNRQYTFVPVGTMIIGFMLGFTDDIISINGRARSMRTVKDSLKDITGHKNVFVRIYNVVIMPWRLYASIFAGFNSSDRKELFPHERYLIYLVIGGIVAWWFYFKIDWPGKDTLWLPFGLSLTLGILMVPFIILTVSLTTIAVAITDGLDGLLASIAIPSFAGFGIIAIIQGSTPLAYFCATIIGALAAYLYFNIKPARVWMGDAGAVALGATLATVAVLLNRPILILVIGFLYVVDFLSSFIQVYGVKLLHRRLLPWAPIHHWFEKLGWDESKIVIRASIFSWLFAIIGIWLSTH